MRGPDNYLDEDYGTLKPTGAARGQSGGGGKKGSMSRSIFTQYDQLTPEQKRAQAKARRLAKKKGVVQQLDAETLELIKKTIERLERAFLDLS